MTMRSSAYCKKQPKVNRREMRQNPIFIPKQIDFTNMKDVTTALSTVVSAFSTSCTTGRKSSNQHYAQNTQENYDDDDDDIGVLKGAVHNSSHNSVFVDILKNLWRAGASTARHCLQDGDTRSSQSVGLRESAGASKKQTDELSSELVLEMRDLTESSEVHKSAHQYLKWHACRKRPRGQHSYFR